MEGNINRLIGAVVALAVVVTIGAVTVQATDSNIKGFFQSTESRYETVTPPLTNQLVSLYLDTNGGEWPGGQNISSRITLERGSMYSFGANHVKPIRRGYTFAGWKGFVDRVPVELTNEGEGPVNSLKVDSSTTLTATWVRNEIVVSLDLKGGSYPQGSGVNNSYTIYQYDSFTLPNETPELKNRIFLGWKVKGSSTIYLPGQTISELTANMTLEAQYNVASAEVIFDTNGGNFNLDDTGFSLNHIVDQGTNFALNSVYPTSPVMDNHSFQGWLNEETGVVHPHNANVLIEKDTKFIAQYKQDELNVQYVLSSDVNWDEERTAIVLKGNSYQIPSTTPNKKWSTFLGWTKDLNNLTDLLAPGASLPSVKENLTLYPVFERNTVTYTYKIPANAVWSESPEGFENNEVTWKSSGYMGEAFVLALTSPSMEDHRFTGWLDASSGTIYQPADLLTMVESDLLLEAQFERETVTVTYDLNDTPEKPAAWLTTQTGDGTTGKGLKYQVTTEAPIREFFDFAGWTLNGQNIGMSTEENPIILSESTMRQNITISARWTPKKSVITFNDGDSVWNTFTLNQGDDFTLPTTKPSKAGSAFTGWEETTTGDTYNPGDKIERVNRNFDFKAIYLENSISITYEYGDAIWSESSFSEDNKNSEAVEKIVLITDAKVINTTPIGIYKDASGNPVVAPTSPLNDQNITINTNGLSIRERYEYFNFLTSEQKQQLEQDLALAIVNNSEYENFDPNSVTKLDLLPETIYEYEYDENGNLISQNAIGTKEKQFVVTREFLGWKIKGSNGQTLYQPNQALPVGNSDIVLEAVYEDVDLQMNYDNYASSWTFGTNPDKNYEVSSLIEPTHGQITLINDRHNMPKELIYKGSSDFVLATLDETGNIVYSKASSSPVFVQFNASLELSTSKNIGNKFLIKKLNEIELVKTPKAAVNYTINFNAASSYNGVSQPIGELVKLSEIIPNQLFTDYPYLKQSGYTTTFKFEGDSNTYTLDSDITPTMGLNKIQVYVNGYPTTQTWLRFELGGHVYTLPVINTSNSTSLGYLSSQNIYMGDTNVIDKQVTSLTTSELKDILMSNMYVSFQGQPSKIKYLDSFDTDTVVGPNLNQQAKGKTLNNNTTYSLSTSTDILSAGLNDKFGGLFTFKLTPKSEYVHLNFVQDGTNRLSKKIKKPINPSSTSAYYVYAEEFSNMNGSSFSLSITRDNQTSVIFPETHNGKTAYKLFNSEAEYIHSNYSINIIPTSSIDRNYYTFAPVISTKNGPNDEWMITGFNKDYIIDYSYLPNTLVIPSSVYGNNTDQYKVTKISANALNMNNISPSGSASTGSPVKYIQFEDPSRIKTIETGAFYGFALEKFEFLEGIDYQSWDVVVTNSLNGQSYNLIREVVLNNTPRAITAISTNLVTFDTNILTVNTPKLLTGADFSVSNKLNFGNEFVKAGYNITSTGTGTNRVIKAIPTIKVSKAQTIQLSNKQNSLVGIVSTSDSALLKITPSQNGLVLPSTLIGSHSDEVNYLVYDEIADLFGGSFKSIDINDLYSNNRFTE